MDVILRSARLRQGEVPLMFVAGAAPHLAGETPDDLRLTLLRPDTRAMIEARALLQVGWRVWRATRQTFQLSAELAFRKVHSRAYPDEPELAVEVSRLRSQLAGLIETAPVPIP